MHIQKIGPDCVLVIAEKSELDGGMEACARMALCESGIAVSGRPSCAAYTAGGETLLFARAGSTPAYYRFSSADGLIDAARRFHSAGRAGGAEVYRASDGGYILKLALPWRGLEEYGERLDKPPEDGLLSLGNTAWERLGK